MFRYVWVAPASLVGLLVAGVAWVLGARATVVDGVLEVAGGRLADLLRRLPPRLQFSAITLGHVIFGLSPDLLALVRGHEHVHVRQYERWGLLFFPLYGGASVVAWLAGGSAYWHNHFERQARREAAIQATKDVSAEDQGSEADEGADAGAAAPPSTAA